MRDYPKAYSQYGASMGRREHHIPDFDGALTVEYVPLDKGGYDPGGAYWGAAGDGVYPLYTAYSEEGEVDIFFRAKDRAAAVAHVKAEYPKATVNEPEHGIDVDEVLDGYVTAALWSSTYQGDEDKEPWDANNEGEPFYDSLPMADRFERDDLAEKTLKSMREDVEAFIKANADDLKASTRNESEIGHDFWLTRNSHGTGFWDRFSRSVCPVLKENLSGLTQDNLARLHEECPCPYHACDRLSKAASACGGVDLYVGDDGKVYGG